MLANPSGAKPHIGYSSQTSIHQFIPSPLFLITTERISLNLTGKLHKIDQKYLNRNVTMKEGNRGTMGEASENYYFHQDCVSAQGPL